MKRLPRTFSLLTLMLPTLFGQAPPAPRLTVLSATAQQVQLSWSPGDPSTGYIVERKPLNGDYASALTGTGTAATDRSIDSAETYVYRVRATVGGNQSGPSNEVTVGPPPFGYNLVAAKPANLDPDHAGNFGRQVRMIVDTNGDPVLAYTFDDPNLDNDYSDSALYFMRWDRTRYQWTAPVQVALIGEVHRSTVTPISIAQDASNGAFGIAFENNSGPTSKITLALSANGGASWTFKTVTAETDENPFYERPSLALRGGNVYVAYFHDFDGIRYVTGKQSDDPKMWTSTLAPAPGGYAGPRPYLSLALDADGKPGIAYMVAGGSDAEVFWRPGNTPVIAADNGTAQNDDPDIRLSFFGTQPRIVFDGFLGQNTFSDYDHDLWMIASPDNGGTWAAPVNVPSDGNRDLTGPIDMSAGSKGQVAVVTENNSGNLGGVMCGDPKLAISNDLVNWTTCGPSPLFSPSFTALSPGVRFTLNDTLYISFQASQDADLPIGIYVWRQPRDWSFPPRQ